LTISTLLQLSQSNLGDAESWHGNIWQGDSSYFDVSDNCRNIDLISAQKWLLQKKYFPS
jgi:hypothetical protein